MVKYPFWVQKKYYIIRYNMRAAAILTFDKRLYLRSRLRLTTSRRLSAYMSSRALATTRPTTSSLLFNVYKRLLKKFRNKRVYKRLFFYFYWNVYHIYAEKLSELSAGMSIDSRRHFFQLRPQFVLWFAVDAPTSIDWLLSCYCNQTRQAASRPTMTATYAAVKVAICNELNTESRYTIRFCASHSLLEARYAIDSGIHVVGWSRSTAL